MPTGISSLDVAPSLQRSVALTAQADPITDREAGAVGLLLCADSEVPGSLGVDAAGLRAAGFETEDDPLDLLDPPVPAAQGDVPVHHDPVDDDSG